MCIPCTTLLFLYLVVLVDALSITNVAGSFTKARPSFRQIFRPEPCPGLVLFPGPWLEICYKLSTGTLFMAVSL
jgi:hypothetical protein